MKTEMRYLTWVSGRLADVTQSCSHVYEARVLWESKMRDQIGNFGKDLGVMFNEIEEVGKSEIKGNLKGRAQKHPFGLQNPYFSRTRLERVRRSDSVWERDGGEEREDGNGVAGERGVRSDEHGDGGRESCRCKEEAVAARELR